MQKTQRKPFRNFIIKRSLQLGIVLKILLFVILSIAITTAIMTWIYGAKSSAGHFYYMSNDVMETLELSTILGVILPSLIAAQLISFIVASIVGLFSSRKVAVPVYKMEKWAEQLCAGNLKHRLQFREEKEMSELTARCNGAADFYGGLFRDIRAAADRLDGAPDDPKVRGEAIASIRNALQKVTCD